MHGFETVRHELDAKRQQLEQELQAAQGRVAELHADLERVHEALEALIGPKKKAKGRARSGKKPAPSVQELQRHIARLREEKPFASAHELQREVRALVRASGGSMGSFPRLFAQALVSSPGFSASSVDAAHLASGSHDLFDTLEAVPGIAPAAHHAHHGEAETHAHESHDSEDVRDSASDDAPFTP